MSSIWLVGLVGIGGSVGALIRYGIGRWAAVKQKPSFYATLIVNLAGSFAIGVIIGVQLEQEHAAAYALTGIGILGGLTTYSTLNVQKATMSRSGSRRTLTYYLAATYIGGFGLTALGIGLGYLLHT